MTAQCSLAGWCHRWGPCSQQSQHTYNSLLYHQWYHLHCTVPTDLLHVVTAQTSTVNNPPSATHSRASKSPSSTYKTLLGQITRLLEFETQWDKETILLLLSLSMQRYFSNWGWDKIWKFGPDAEHFFQFMVWHERRNKGVASLSLKSL